MIALELFSGSQSFRKVAEQHGVKVYSLDILDVQGLTTEFIMDYMDFDVTKLDFIPDFVWASPDCAAFSVAAGAKHFDSGSIEPKTEKAKQSIEVVKKLHADLLFLTKLNPKLIFWIENPVGKMEWLPFMKTGLFQQIDNFRVVQLDQCAYGREFRKATHIFTNDQFLIGKKCIGKNCHHAKGDSFNNGYGNLKSFGSGSPVSAWKTSGEHRNNQAKVSLESGYWKRAMLPPALFEQLLSNYITGS